MRMFLLAEEWYGAMAADGIVGSLAPSSSRPASSLPSNSK